MKIFIDTTLEIGIIKEELKGLFFELLANITVPNKSNRKTQQSVEIFSHNYSYLNEIKIDHQLSTDEFKLNQIGGSSQESFIDAVAKNAQNDNIIIIADQIMFESDKIISFLSSRKLKTLIISNKSSFSFPPNVYFLKGIIDENDQSELEDFIDRAHKCIENFLVVDEENFSLEQNQDLPLRDMSKIPQAKSISCPQTLPRERSLSRGKHSLNSQIIINERRGRLLTSKRSFNSQESEQIPQKPTLAFGASILSPGPDLNEKESAISLKCDSVASMNSDFRQRQLFSTNSRSSNSTQKVGRQKIMISPAYREIETVPDNRQESPPSIMSTTTQSIALIQDTTQRFPPRTPQSQTSLNLEILTPIRMASVTPQSQFSLNPEMLTPHRIVSVTPQSQISIRQEELALK